jgi:hypothetical protein
VRSIGIIVVVAAVVSILSAYGMSALGIGITVNVWVSIMEFVVVVVALLGLHALGRRVPPAH